MTLRKVMDSLIAEGLLERRHGSGTYVTPQPTVRLLGLTSFTEDMRARGLAPTSRLMDFASTPATAVLAGKLDIPEGEEVLTFTRLRLADDVPMALETVWVPKPLVPGLTRSELSGSLYELLAERYRIAPSAAHVTIAPLTPDPEMQRLLSIPQSQACLRIHLVDSDASGRVIMVSDCVYRGDRYHLTADITGTTFTSSTARRIA